MPVISTLDRTHSGGSTKRPLPDDEQSTMRNIRRRITPVLDDSCNSCSIDEVVDTSVLLSCSEIDSPGSFGLEEEYSPPESESSNSEEDTNSEADLEESVGQLSIGSPQNRKEIWDLSMHKLQRASSDACLRKSVLIVNMVRHMQDGSSPPDQEGVGIEEDITTTSISADLDEDGDISASWSVETCSDNDDDSDAFGIHEPRSNTCRKYPSGTNRESAPVKCSINDSINSVKTDPSLPSYYDHQQTECQSSFSSLLVPPSASKLSVSTISTCGEVSGNRDSTANTACNNSSSGLMITSSNLPTTMGHPTEDCSIFADSSLTVNNSGMLISHDHDGERGGIVVTGATKSLTMSRVMSLAPTTTTAGLPTMVPMHCAAASVVAAAFAATVNETGPAPLRESPSDTLNSLISLEPLDSVSWIPPPPTCSPPPIEEVENAGELQYQASLKMCDENYTDSARFCRSNDVTNGIVSTPELSAITRFRQEYLKSFQIIGGGGFLGDVSCSHDGDHEPAEDSDNVMDVATSCSLRIDSHAPLDFSSVGCPESTAEVRTSSSSCSTVVAANPSTSNNCSGMNASPHSINSSCGFAAVGPPNSVNQVAEWEPSPAVCYP